MTDATSAPAASEGIELARRVLETEAQAILGIIPQLNGDFDRAIDLLHGCTGRVVTTGMGKSGIIAHKLAATLSSTGTPSIFLHPAEALHGDLGMVQPNDVVLALSRTGETAELVRLLQAIRRIGATIISMTGFPRSTLGQASDVSLSCHVAEEACPMNLAPTASTTAALALGDALAMALSQRKGFRAEHFANLHPGGQLGKKLMKVATLMHTGTALPAVRPEAPMPEVLHEMTSKRLGMTCVVDRDRRLVGIVTDGDIRRHLTAGSNPLTQSAADLMTPRPVTIDRHMLAVEALRLMEERKITSLVVVDAGRVLEGVLHLHDLWRTNMI
jgi:arabinose-5-phosphate isomerase